MTATELSKKLAISAATLRSWEKHFAIWLSPDYKTDKIYSQSAFQQFAVIKYLITERGFTVEGALKEIERRESMDGDQVFLIEKLHSLRGFLIDLREKLD
jgi:DNA-binding transcriptional MerR regulator